MILCKQFVTYADYEFADESPPVNLIWGSSIVLPDMDRRRASPVTLHEVTGNRVTGTPALRVRPEKCEAVFR